MKKRTFLLITAFMLVCLFVLISATLASNETAQPNNKTVPERCDSTLLSVVVGALIALISSVGTGTIVSILQSRHERKVFMRSKSEELIFLAYQCDDWLDQLTLGYLVQGNINTVFDRFPVNKMKMLQVQYFQNLEKETDILIVAVKELRKSIILERENFSKRHQYSDEFLKSYERKQATVLNAIQNLAEKARTKEAL